MDGINFEAFQHRLGTAISKQVFDELDEIDGVKDDKIDKSIFDTVENLVRLYNSTSNKSEWQAWLDNADEIAQKVGKVLVNAFNQKESVQEDSVKPKKAKNKKDNKEAELPEVKRMQEISDELIQKMEAAAKDKKDMFSNNVTKIKNFPIGVVIKHFGVNINYDNPENDEANIDLQDGKVTTIRKPDGLEIVIQFSLNGQSYSVKSFSNNSDVIKQLEEEDDVTLEREDSLIASINGVTNDEE